MGSHKSPPANSDPRLIALETVGLVLDKGAYANIALEKVLRSSGLKLEDRNLVTEIVNGTIRMLKHLDWVLNLFLQQPVTKQNPWLRNILRISLYQMLFMEKIPDYASVNSAVELCQAKNINKLAPVVNGVLRNIARHRNDLRYPDKNNPVEYLAVVYSQPEWLVEKWLQEYEPDQVVHMLAYCNRRPELVLRTNVLKVNRGELLEILAGDGIKCRPSDQTPWGIKIAELDRSLTDLESYRDGLFYVQNEASMLAVSILDPHPGESLADLASGVGGKATFMAQMMGNLGRIDAYELHSHKLKLLQENCLRLGISIIHGHEQDIRSLESDSQIFAGVLLDAPCSGLGVLNRRADLRWNKDPAGVQEIVELQKELLAAAAKIVAPGGRLIYCTCTINPEENQGIINDFLSSHSDFWLEDFINLVEYFPLDEQDRKQARAGMLTILPGKYDTDGMFYARIRKNRSSGQ